MTIDKMMKKVMVIDHIFHPSQLPATAAHDHEAVTGGVVELVIEALVATEWTMMNWTSGSNRVGRNPNRNPNGKVWRGV